MSIGDKVTDINISLLYNTISEGGIKMSVREIKTDEFDRALQADKTVLVDFYADWCAPCKMQSVVLDDFAKEAKDIEIVKVNVDSEGELAARYKVSSIPTLMVVKNGEVVKIEPGFKSKPDLERFVNI